MADVVHVIHAYLYLVDSGPDPVLSGISTAASGTFDKEMLRRAPRALLRSAGVSLSLSPINPPR